MKTDTAKKIVEYISENKQATAKELVDYLEISRQAVFKHLSQLLTNNQIYKTGKPPKVFYFVQKEVEKKVLADFDKGNFVSVKKLKSEKAKYHNYAKLTLSKSKNINIRLSEKDLQKIKAKAVMRGLPYQTLLSSLIHQYADDERSKNKIRF